MQISETWSGAKTAHKPGGKIMHLVTHLLGPITLESPSRSTSFCYGAVGSRRICKHVCITARKLPDTLEKYYANGIVLETKLPVWPSVYFRGKMGICLDTLKKQMSVKINNNINNDDIDRIHCRQRHNMCTHMSKQQSLSSVPFITNPT